MDFSNVAVDPAMGIVVVALIAFGYFLKSTPDIPDWMIGWILLVLAIVAALFKIGVSVDGVVNGIIAASIAVYGNTLFKQTVTNRIADRTGGVASTTIDLPKVEVKDAAAAQEIVDVVNENTTGQLSTVGPDEVKP